MGSEMSLRRRKRGSQVDVRAALPLLFGLTVPVLAVEDVEQASSDGVILLLKPCWAVHLVLQACTHNNNKTLAVYQNNTQRERERERERDRDRERGGNNKEMISLHPLGDGKQLA